MEMKLALVLTILVSGSMGQKIIYPDEFDSMLAATPGRDQYRPEALPINSNGFINSISNGFGGFNSPPLPAVPEYNTQMTSTGRSQTTDVISKGILRFALNMDDAVAVSRSRYAPGSRENVIFSPLSVASTLALVLLGSARATFDEVSSILGLNNVPDIYRNSEPVHQMFGSIISAITSTPGQAGLPETSFANGIFVQDGYPIRDEFKEASEEIYNSEVINLDYVNDGSGAQKTVNAWVTNKTRGKIPNILSSPPPAETSVIIASALYFNGEWNQHFIDGSTRSKVFTVAPGETVNVDMMYNGGEFPFFEDRQLRAKIVGLPYKGREMTMYVLLPNDKGNDALRTLERSLSTDALENLIRNMQNQTCIIGLPRMKLTSTLSLRDALQAMGLNSLFNPSSADLSLISPGYTGTRQNPPTPTSRPTSTDAISFANRFPEVNRRNFFSYDDTRRGYHIEQWATGFSIGRISRQKRSKSLSARKWRVKRNAVSKDAENTGENVSADNLQRSRRQTNQGFRNDLGNQNQAAYRLDYLRNNGPLSNPRLFADDVLHKVEIDITEKGTEAAAATSVILTKDGSQKRLVADHPFLFFIRHEPTGLILFWGSVNKPTPNSPSRTTKR